MKKFECLAYLMIDGVIEGDPVKALVSMRNGQLRLRHRLIFPPVSRSGIVSVAFYTSEHGIFAEIGAQPAVVTGDNASIQ